MIGTTNEHCLGNRYRVSGGALAKLVMPGKDPGGIIITTLLGIGGALMANFVGAALGLYAEGETAGFIAAVLGAIAILAIYRMFKKKG